MLKTSSTRVNREDVKTVLVSHDLYITHVSSGLSSPLLGAEGGDDGCYSPDGQQIAFDDFTGIWIVAASGGTATQLVGNGLDPSWSPDGSKIVYRDAAGDLWTIAVTGGHGYAADFRTR